MNDFCDRLHDALCEQGFVYCDLERTPSLSYRFRYENLGSFYATLRPSQDSRTNRAQLALEHDSYGLLASFTVQPDNYSEKMAELGQLLTTADGSTSLELIGHHNPALSMLYEHDRNYVKEHAEALCSVFDILSANPPLDALLKLHELPEPERVLDVLQTSLSLPQLSEGDTKTVARMSGDVVAGHGFELDWAEPVAFLSALLNGQLDLVDRLGSQINTEALSTQRIIEICFGDQGDDLTLRGALNRFRSEHDLRELPTLHPFGKWLSSEAPLTYRQAHFRLFDHLNRFPALTRMQDPAEALRVVWDNGHDPFVPLALGVDKKEALALLDFLSDHDLAARIEAELALFHDRHSRESSLYGSWEFLFNHRNHPGFSVTLRDLIDLGLDDQGALTAWINERDGDFSKLYHRFLNSRPAWLPTLLRLGVKVPERLRSKLIEELPQHKERIQELSQPPSYD